MRADFSDTHAVVLPAGSSSDARRWHDAVFPPDHPVGPLLRLRNALVRPLGLRPARPGSFPVLAESADEVVVGLDDRHLDFRGVLRVDDGVLSLRTDVRFHNALGRAYFLPVRLLHPVVVRRALRGAVSRTLTGQRAPATAAPPAGTVDP